MKEAFLLSKETLEKEISKKGKMMKKIYTAICAILLITSVSAQERQSQTIFERLIWDDKMLNIMLDTRTFSLHVGVRTFEAAAWLRRLGAQNR